MLHGQGHDVGRALVQHAAIAAVGFTGSLAGGRAIFDRAAARPRPIPVYAEMGSVNPIVLMPAASPFLRPASRQGTPCDYPNAGFGCNSILPLTCCRAASA